MSAGLTAASSAAENPVTGSVVSSMVPEVMIASLSDSSAPSDASNTVTGSGTRLPTLGDKKANLSVGMSHEWVIDGMDEKGGYGYVVANPLSISRSGTSASPIASPLAGFDDYYKLPTSIPAAMDSSFLHLPISRDFSDGRVSSPSASESAPLLASNQNSKLNLVLKWTLKRIVLRILAYTSLAYEPAFTYFLNNASTAALIEIIKSLKHFGVSKAVIAEAAKSAGWFVLPLAITNLLGDWMAVRPGQEPDALSMGVDSVEPNSISAARLTVFVRWLARTSSYPFLAAADAVAFYQFRPDNPKLFIGAGAGAIISGEMYYDMLCLNTMTKHVNSFFNDVLNTPKEFWERVRANPSLYMQTFIDGITNCLYRGTTAAFIVNQLVAIAGTLLKNVSTRSSWALGLTAYVGVATAVVTAFTRVLGVRDRYLKNVEKVAKANTSPSRAGYFCRDNALSIARDLFLGLIRAVCVGVLSLNGNTPWSYLIVALSSLISLLHSLRVSYLTLTAESTNRLIPDSNEGRTRKNLSTNNSVELFRLQTKYYDTISQDPSTLTHFLIFAIVMVTAGGRMCRAISFPEFASALNDLLPEQLQLPFQKVLALAGLLAVPVAFSDYGMYFDSIKEGCGSYIANWRLAGAGIAQQAKSWSDWFLSFSRRAWDTVSSGAGDFGLAVYARLVAPIPLNTSGADTAPDTSVSLTPSGHHRILTSAYPSFHAVSTEEVREEGSSTGHVASPSVS